MARCFPDRLALDTPDSERAVFAALTQLPDPWRVFHSVTWQGIRNGHPGDGEADFVLLHPEHGMLVLETKGGGISVDQGRWSTIDRENQHHGIKNPFHQACDSKHALIQYVRGALNDLPFLSTGHAVAFPDITSRGALGADAPAELQMNRTDLREPEKAVSRIVEHWEMNTRLDTPMVDAITALLAPTVTVRALLADEIADVNARLLRLTKDQLLVLDGLRRTRRAIIYGGAGTGKTVLAVERARRLAAEGSRVLLTCFNRPLADHLSREFAGQKNATVYSFHALSRWQIGAAGMEFPNEPPPSFWDDEVADLLATAAEKTGFAVEAVVVDEGQDFAPSWFAALQMLLADPDAGPLYVFADTHQAIYREAWAPPLEGLEFELSTNCRNTLPIAEAVAGVIGDKPVSFGASGPDPEFLVVDDQNAAMKQVRGLLHRFLNEEGLRPEQVVVLTQQRDLCDRLRNERMANQPLVKIGESGVVADTIHRFKGLEADVVIVVLNRIETEKDKALAYIGMSRAKGQLVVMFCEPGNR